MRATTGIGGGAVGPWYRVQAIMAGRRRGGSAEQDYAAVLPAVLNAAMYRRPFVAGWLSRGGGAPLELITNAGPLLEPKELLFPWGARGVPMSGGLLADLDRLVWAPCPGRQAAPLGWDAGQSGWDLPAVHQGRAGPYGPHG